MGSLTHIDDDGRARMVDVSGKAATVREAVASGRLTMAPATLALALSNGGAKGDVRAVAEIAGVMAAKRTADLIPMCHPLDISMVEVKVDQSAEGDGLSVRARVRTTGRTGVEMEALTAVSVALLTLYDMLKAADRAMAIQQVVVESKAGGASGDWSRSD